MFTNACVVGIKLERSGLIALLYVQNITAYSIMRPDHATTVVREV
jgi:hypothetical protein